MAALRIDRCPIGLAFTAPTESTGIQRNSESLYLEELVNSLWISKIGSNCLGSSKWIQSRDKKIKPRTIQPCVIDFRVPYCCYTFYYFVIKKRQVILIALSNRLCNLHKKNLSLNFSTSHRRIEKPNTHFPNSIYLN